MKFSRNIILAIIVGIILVAAIATISVQIKNAGKIDEAALIVPKSITVDHSLDKATADQMIRAAKLFYTFWNTGETKYLDAVISSHFIDNTLPESRPQGPEGIREASANFRKSIPDLHCSIEELLIVGDKITARLVFTGTSEGEFMGQQPTGKPIKFIAIDVLHIQKGKLIEDWHLEDNLTLLKQLNIIK